MKLIITGTISLLLIFNVAAQRHVKRPVAKKKMVRNHKVMVVKQHRGERADVIRVLKKTNKVIIAAHSQVKKNKVYTGDLSKAVHHQKYAKKLLKKHKAHYSMQHSRIARKYAIKAIKNNKGTVGKEMEFNNEENKIIGKTISDEELEKELLKNEPNTTYDDKTISDKEMTDLEVLEMDEADYKNE